MNAYGAFTGSIVLDGKMMSFRGKIDAQGHWAKTLTNTGAIFFDQDLSTGAIAGTLSVSATTAQFAGNKLPVYTVLDPTPLAGRYTIALQPVEPPLLPELPHGTGCATAKISDTGTARLVGRLADATPFAASIPLNDQNDLALSARFSRDTLNGTLRFSDQNPATDVDGTISWSRSPSAKIDSMWAAGFSTSVAPIGSKWTKPVTGFRVLSALDGNNGLANVELNSGSAIISTTIFVSDRNVVVENPPSARLFKLVTVAGTGSLRGSFLDGDRKAFRGVFLQKQMAAEGYFLNGTIRVTPAP